MPFDALTLSVLTAELSKNLENGKISKITQPEKDEISLQIYNGQNYKLVISASSSLPRMHLSNDAKDNPLVAPSFCMLLRKHLTGGQIVKVWQQPFERAVVLDVFASDELSDKTLKHLICELTGKSANVFLTDENYKILGALKTNPLNSLTDRPTLAGMTYRFLTQDKIAPDDAEALYALLENNQPNDAKEFLKDKIKGLSTVTLEEIVKNETDPRLVADAFTCFLKKLETPSAFLVLSKDGSPLDALPADYSTITANKVPYPSLNEAFGAYFSGKDSVKRQGEKTRQISQIVKNTIARLEKKIALQKETLIEAKESEANRICGELIISNLYKIKKGDKLLTTENFYEIGQPEIKIPLDELLTPQQNAQKYFKKYAKQKKTAQHTEVLLAENEQQLNYLRSISLSLSSPLESADIAEITDELNALKLVKKAVKKSGAKTQKSGSKKPQKIKAPVSKPLTYSINGYCVLAGKNNVQNDRLTFTTAKGSDIWLHTKNIHSAHVIIVNPSGSEIPSDVLTTAAEITAYYSEAKNSSKVEVDYTVKKNVKKPNGSPLGFVTYTQFKTCAVNPDAHADLLKK